MKSTFYVLILFFILISCSSDSIEMDKLGLGIWRLAESTDNSDKSSSEDPLLNEAKKLEEGKKGHVLSLFPDHTFTEIIGGGEYYYGKWNFFENGTKINLNYQDKKVTFDLKTDYADTNNITMQLKNNQKEMVFIREAELLKNYKEEPFYAANNSWRIKPSKPETNKELEDRLANYFQHMVYLLKAADTRNLDVISFEFSMGIIKIYNGGIGIHDYEVLPEEWRNTYYDEADLSTIYNMYADYLETSRYRGASRGDWVKDDYKIALSIYNDIKLGKLQSPTITE